MKKLMIITAATIATAGVAHADTDGKITGARDNSFQQLLFGAPATQETTRTEADATLSLPGRGTDGVITKGEAKPDYWSRNQDRRVEFTIRRRGS